MKKLPPLHRNSHSVTSTLKDITVYYIITATLNEGTTVITLKWLCSNQYIE